MAALTRISAAQAAASRLKIEFSRDGFSIRASRPSDRLFWIRIEPPVEDEIVVTDFKTEMLQPVDQVEALLATLAEAGVASVQHIRFCDIAPGEGIASQRGSKEIARHQALAATLAARLSVSVAGAAPQLRRGKVDFVVTLGRQAREPETRKQSA